MVRIPHHTNRDSKPGFTLVLDGVSAFPRSCLTLSPLVSHCLPTCVPLLDGVSETLSPLSPTLSPSLSPTLSPSLSLPCLAAKVFAQRELRRL